MKFRLLPLIIIFSGSLAFAEEEGKTKERIGPGKAVVAADEKSGFKLSDKALASLKLSLMKVNGHNQVVPASALVKFQDFLAVYRLRDGWYRMIEVEPSIQGAHATFTSSDLKPGDELVIANGALLRVVELDIFGPEADACAD